MIDKRKISLLVVCLTLATVSWLSSMFGLLPEATSNTLGLVAAVIGLLFIGHSAIGTLMEGIFGIDVLATTAIAASIIVGEYLAAAVVVFMLGGGEVLEDYAQARASKAIEKLVEAMPLTATVLRDGGEVEVRVEEVERGEVVLVKPGGRIPVDGIVRKGKATVDQSSVTGESMPIEKAEGDQVYSGTLLDLGALEVEVTATGEESTYGRIIKMVREAEENQAPIVRLADRFAKYFIPIILLIGVAVYWYTGNLLRMAAVFIIACPCALTLATPTAVVASIGNSARRGILIRNGESLETLSRVDTLVLDKTGTITKGLPEVVDVAGFNGVDVEDVIRMAATAERHSEHPLAQAVLRMAEEKGIAAEEWGDFEVHPGLGVRVTDRTGSITVGSGKMMAKYSIPLGDDVVAYLEEEQMSRTPIFVAKDVAIVGVLLLSDTLRDGVAGMLKEVKLNGIEKTVMLTGDHVEVAKMIADEVGVDEMAADLLPSQKVDYIRGLKEEGRRVLMVGDGINDAPALAMADVGVAMGISGTDVAIETAGITLSTDDLHRLPPLLRIGRETMKVVRLNIAFAMLVNLLGIILSVMGLVSPLVASFIHEGSALIVMANSLRLLRVE